MMLGRGIAAVGVVCGLIALWTSGIGTSKYWDDGSFGGLLLILAIVAGLLLLASFVNADRSYDLAVGAIGGFLLGSYLFIPAILAFNHFGRLDSGAWFGVCTVLIVLGAAMAVWPTMMTRRTAAPLGVLVALGGLVLCLIAIWTKASDTGQKYWTVPGEGHSLGELMLILIILTALAFGAAYAGMMGMTPALLLSTITAGLFLYGPVHAAFGHFGDLRIGGWLGGFGGILLMLGVVAMWQTEPAGAQAPATTAVPPPSPPA